LSVSGKSYADVLRDEVFVPLGLTESSVKLAPTWMTGVRFATGEIMWFPSTILIPAGLLPCL
jgi:CubicO group peptidase (beta-lactamase class C family)